MKLSELRLRNFRQHADTTIRFREGLTGIIGPNGAGKSTLLEAIAWAIYGSEAARGTNDTLRFSRAPARSRVQVDLSFSLGGHHYRVVRTLSSAEVFLDGGAAPVATTVGGATRYLVNRLGMSRREFFNTYFTGQKELQFLAAMGPTERGRFLSTVLGYERLRLAQDLARTRRSELRHEIDGLRSGMGDGEAIAAEHRQALATVLDARSALAAAEGEQALAGVAVNTLTPRWAEAQARLERHRELISLQETNTREEESAARDLERGSAELEKVSGAERELAVLRERLLPLPALRERCERLAQLARTAERRRALQEQLSDIRAELERTGERLRKVEQAPALLERFAAELEALRAERGALEAEREAGNEKWLEDRQDARTKLLGYRDRGTELRDQVAQLKEAGPAGICPTCQRPLGTDFERLLGELEDQLALSTQDERWWDAREKQLAERPPELVALEERLEEQERAIDDRARKHSRCEGAIGELKALQQERQQREERLVAVQREVDSLPDGYDAAAHREAEATLGGLRELETAAARLEEVASRREPLEREIGTARAAIAAARERRVGLTDEHDRLGFSDEWFATLRAEVESANDRMRAAELRSTELRGRLATAEEVLAGAARAEDQYRQRAAEVERRDLELRHNGELDAALTRLRAELNAQVRPELGEIASAFLAQLTDGRYTSLEIDESYNILVLDEGEEKPVISGGEEDVANLVLRLSLSQMIAERAGHPLSLLILDEVFGSLDIARRDNVVQLLRRLDDRFDQVILITHVEGIRDSLDQVIRVSFDERTGSAQVRDEAPDPAAVGEPAGQQLIASS
jgi:DNA repair protein SbcC/Rad50